MKTGNAAASRYCRGPGLRCFSTASVIWAFQVLPGSGGRLVPWTGSRGSRPLAAGGILVLLWKVPCASGPLAAGGILSVLKGWGVKGVALIHGLYQSEGLVPCKK